MSLWTRDQLAAFSPEAVARTPVIDRSQAAKILPGVDLWDIGPVRTVDGGTASVCGRTLWLGLSAVAHDDPRLRHDVAALRMFWHATDGWHDLGPLLDAEQAHGSRQWAASAVLLDDSLWITYTATGDRGEAELSFKQRMYEVVADIDCSSGAPVLNERGPHVELFAPDGDLYDLADEAEGKPGFIKAFRDPFPFRDPADSQDYILFAGSLPRARSTTDFNGAIGVAVRDPSSASGWRLDEPLLSADGVNNELERPHIVVHDGRYYLFFSTQARTFHPDVSGPSGLYGFVADSVRGPYEPLNGSGVVFANPVEEPIQAYSWLVLQDLTTVSFVDAHSLQESAHVVGSDEVAADRAHFGGTIAPAVRIGLDGTTAWIAGEAPLP